MTQAPPPPPQLPPSFPPNMPPHAPQAPQGFPRSPQWEPAPARKGWGCFAAFMVLLALGGFAVIALIAVSAFIGSNDTPSFSFGGSQVGVLRLEGSIVDSRKTLKELKKLRENTRVKAIVVRIDSPGGAVGASEEIYREVLRLRKEDKKPVVVSMGNAAASGGYYVATAADKIYANGGTLTASIGVIVSGVGFWNAMEKLGLSPVTIKSGEHKDSGSPFKPLGPEERAYLQNVIFDTYRQFFAHVLEARWKAMAAALKKDPEALARVAAPMLTKRPGAGLEWEAFTTGTIASAVGATTETETALRMVADGRILSGDQARAIGLIDEIGGLDDAISDAAKMAGLTKDQYSVLDKEPRSELPFFLSEMARDFVRSSLESEPMLQYR